MEKFDSDAFALDFLQIMREVAGNPSCLTGLMDSLFSGPESEPELHKLIRAVTRLRYLEIALLESLSDGVGLGPIGAAESYRDLSKSVIMAALVHKEETAARLRCYYPHLMTEADLERVRLTVKTGMSREDAGRAAEYLIEIQKRLRDRLSPS